MAEFLGWAAIHRSLLEHPLWTSEPFTKGQAWVDLIMLANHKPTKIMIKNQVVNLERGQLAWSEVNLAKRWKWSRGKIRRFLKTLKTEQMTVQQTVQVTTIITICNYSSFQDIHNQGGTANGTKTVHQTVQRRYIDNNVTNINSLSLNNNLASASAQKIGIIDSGWILTESRIDMAYDEVQDFRLIDQIDLIAKNFFDHHAAHKTKAADFDPLWRIWLRNEKF